MAQVVDPEDMFTPNPIAHQAILIRYAQRGDEAELRRLAQLDSAPPLRGSAIVAERDGTIVAARALDGEQEIADPFVPTAGLLALLRVRSASQPAAPKRTRGGRLRRGLAGRGTAAAGC